MKKSLIILSLILLMFSCKKKSTRDDQLPDKPRVLNPKVRELLSNHLIDSVAETGGTITGYFRDGRKTVFTDSTKSVSLDSRESSSVASTSSGSLITVSFSDPQLATENPALVHFYANVGCELVNSYAMVTSVSGMAMAVTNGSTTIYHPGPAGQVTTYYTTIADPHYYHSPLYLPTVTLTWTGTKLERKTHKAGHNNAPISSSVSSAINASRTVSAAVSGGPPPS